MSYKLRRKMLKTYSDGEIKDLDVLKSVGTTPSSNFPSGNTPTWLSPLKLNINALEQKAQELIEEVNNSTSGVKADVESLSSKYDTLNDKIVLKSEPLESTAPPSDYTNYITISSISSQSGYPTAGTLTTYKSSTSRAYQILVSLANGITATYVRSWNGSNAWNSWEQIAVKSDVTYGSGNATMSSGYSGTVTYRQFGKIVEIYMGISTVIPNGVWTTVAKMPFNGNGSVHPISVGGGADNIGIARFSTNGDVDIFHNSPTSRSCYCSFSTLL